MRIVRLQSLINMALLLCWIALASKAAAEPASDPIAEPTIAVLDLVDKGPSVELAALRTAFAEMLAGELSQYRGIGLVERARVEEFLRERNLQKGFSDIDAAAVERAGQTLAAKYLLTGSFAGKDKTVSLDVSLFRVGELEPLLRWERSGPVEKLIEFERELAGEVLERLGIDKPERRPPPKPKPGPSPLVAVSALRNLSTTAKLDPMQSGFADILQANLGTLENVRLVERKKLYEILQEQKLSLSNLVDPATAVKLGKLLGAERLIYGSFVQLDGQLHLTVRLADTQSSEILATETAAGSLESFADLVEATSLRLAADLAIAPQNNAAELMKASTPTRKLEAALHFAAGQRFYYTGYFKESAEAYERLLLVDPGNTEAGIRCMDSWNLCRNYKRAVEIGNQAIANLGGKADREKKVRLYVNLAAAYSILKRYDECVEMYKKAIHEHPYPANRCYEILLARSLMQAGRRSEGIELLEATIKKEKGHNNTELYIDALASLEEYFMHENIIINNRFHRPISDWSKEDKDPSFRKILYEQSRQNALRIMELDSLIIKEAEGKQNEFWHRHAWNMLEADIRWNSEGDIYASDHYLDYDTQEKRYSRMLEVFAWIPCFPRCCHYKLAWVRERLGKWDKAAESMSFVLKDWGGYYSNWWRLHDELCLGDWTPLDSRIDLQFRLANIYRNKLKDIEKAKYNYRQIAENFGFTHLDGYALAKSLDELGDDIEVPEKSALVWGGGGPSYVAWEKRLAPLGYRVHYAGMQNVDVAHMALYPLVILVRTGKIKLTPSQVLAIRHYVATGGSLLVVISPGWEHAQPCIHNTLLSFFDIHAQREQVIRAESTKIASHPITKGIEKSTAKCAVHLESPVDAALITAGDRTVLAAVPYRHGRVVVASYGQWFTPDPDLVVEELRQLPGHWTYELPQDQLPAEANGGQEVQLLNNVLAWLLAPHQSGGEMVEQRNRFVKAQLANLKMQYRVITRDRLKTIMQELIDTAPPGVWKEESLWAAGEAFQRLYYMEDTYSSECYRWPAEERPPTAEPEYYRQLLQQFPSSPLSPFAQWRLGSCKWRELYKKAYNRWAPTHITQGRESVVEAYDKVRTPAGSLAWAWSRLSAGAILMEEEDFSGALPYFCKVAERMEQGQEKSLAIINAALCYENLNDTDSATRYYKMALQIPDITCSNIYYGPFEPWGQVHQKLYVNNQTTHGIAGYRLSVLNQH